MQRLAEFCQENTLVIANAVFQKDKRRLYIWRKPDAHFQRNPFDITVIQVYAPTTNAKEPEVDWFYEGLHDLLELTPKKDVLFMTGDWNPKVGSQEIPGIIDKFGIGVQIEAGQSLTEFC